MLDLGKIRYKNFFSSGNAFLEFDLNLVQKTIVTGKNGAGKSSFLNAIIFALFGRTIKNINKPNIVNSVNKKDCLVEIEFTTPVGQFLVRRGIKPNIFEIYQDGKMLDQTLTGDYQTHLEEKILKTSYRSFTQTSVISVENYKPFMTLTKGERREFIEDILDIKIFSHMNSLLKSEISKAKEELKILEVEIKGAKEKASLVKSHIEDLQKNRESEIQEIHNSIETIKNDLEERTTTRIFLTHKIKENQKKIEELETLKEPLGDPIQDAATLTLQIKQLEKEGSALEHSTTCKSCRQDITEDHKKHIFSEAQVKIAAHAELLEEATKRLSKYTPIINKITDINDILSGQRDEEKTLLWAIGALEKEQAKLKEKLSKITEPGDLINEKKEQLKKIVKEAVEKQNRRSFLLEEKDYQDATLELLKDSGIKSKIIKQYVPVINRLVNKYLEELDFFVSFNLDEEFNEVIKSRHRDDFTYYSFSAGERQRIDLALLFTMRKIAKMKNSMSCNNIYYDEIFEASVDADGIDRLLAMLNSDDMRDSNIFVISHSNKEKFLDNFNVSLEFRKEGNFTSFYLTEI